MAEHKSPTPRTQRTGSNGRQPETRLDVLKTYKVYINGKFPRSESGRYDIVTAPDGTALASICRCSKKDFREAVIAARGAAGAWASASTYLRGQILYRIAEMLEGRRAQFEAELQSQGMQKAAAVTEVSTAIDRLVYYAGWSDKMQQIFSSVNPVSSSHFNFSVCEPTGVVSIIAPADSALLGLVSSIAPAIVGGNTCVLLASSRFALTAVTFAEVLNASDVPGGVVNILTGRRDELMPHFASHMDVNAIVYCGGDGEEIKAVVLAAADNVKRAIIRRDVRWSDADAQGPYHILDTQEIKTTWHPIGT